MRLAEVCCTARVTHTRTQTHSAHTKSIGIRGSASTDTALKRRPDQVSGTLQPSTKFRHQGETSRPLKVPRRRWHTQTHTIGPHRLLFCFRVAVLGVTSPSLMTGALQHKNCHRYVDDQKWAEMEHDTDGDRDEEEDRNQRPIHTRFDNETPLGLDLGRKTAGRCNAANGPAMTTGARQPALQCGHFFVFLLNCPLEIEKCNRMGPMGGAFFTLSTHLLAPFQAFKCTLRRHI